MNLGHLDIEVCRTVSGAKTASGLGALADPCRLGI